MRGCFRLLVLSFLLIWAPPLSYAELTPEQEATAKGVFFDVMSPYCAGRSLNDCPSSAANDLKKEIRSMVGQGKSREVVVNELVSRYGEEIRAVPSTKGFDLLAWVVPAIFLVLGAIAIRFWLQRNFAAPKDSAETGAPIPTAIDEEMQKRIDAAVRQAD